VNIVTLIDGGEGTGPGKPRQPICRRRDVRCQFLQKPDEVRALRDERKPISPDAVGSSQRVRRAVFHIEQPWIENTVAGTS